MSRGEEIDTHNCEERGMQVKGEMLYLYIIIALCDVGGPVIDMLYNIRRATIRAIITSCSMEPRYFFFHYFYERGQC